MNKKLISKIKKILIEELNLPNEEEKEKLRIELYKTLQNSMKSMQLTDRSIIIDFSTIQNVLEKYNYSLLYSDIEIPIIRKQMRNN